MMFKLEYTLYIACLWDWLVLRVHPLDVFWCKWRTRLVNWGRVIRLLTYTKQCCFGRRNKIILQTPSSSTFASMPPFFLIEVNFTSLSWELRPGILLRSWAIFGWVQVKQRLAPHHPRPLLFPYCHCLENLAISRRIPKRSKKRSSGAQAWIGAADTSGISASAVLVWWNDID